MYYLIMEKIFFFSPVTLRILKPAGFVDVADSKIDR